jgi:hypothetical protein
MFSLVTGKMEIIIQVAETLWSNLFVLFFNRVRSLKRWLVHLLGFANSQIAIIYT